MPTSSIGVSSGIIQVAAFSTHSCALYSTGAVQCWGSSANGRLGDNTSQSLHQPLSVSGLGFGNTQIEVGSHHSCALTSAGGIKCWGYNSKGQIGDNSTVNRLSATDGVGLTSGVTQIAGGANHTCALTTAGAVKCWGDNFIGELGDNTNVNKSVPTDTLTLSSGVTQIVGGSSHTCALTTAGGVKCWGGNTTGQIGDNTLTARWVPTDVLGLTAGVSQITAGAGFTCALTAAGAVMCWGQNTYGQIGDNSTTTRRVPTQVFGLTSGITQIDAGGNYVCALSSSGAVSCWGNNSYGQLGDNTIVWKSVPVPVFGLSSGMAQISSGNGHACALSAAGGLKCWGYNVHGQIGNSDFSVNDYRVPTDVSGLSSGVSQVSAGYDHTCYLVSRIGAVQCFGRNINYQLGNTSEGGVPRSVVAAP